MGCAQESNPVTTLWPPAVTDTGRPVFAAYPIVESGTCWSPGTLEVIEVPGYTRTEKRAIAEQFLVPKQLKEHALKPEVLSFSREGIEAIIDFYTREAGVRGLEREIAGVCRDAVRLRGG